MSATVRVVVEHGSEIEIEFRSDQPTRVNTSRAEVADWWAGRLEEIAKDLRKMWRDE